MAVGVACTSIAMIDQSSTKSACRTGINAIGRGTGKTKSTICTGQAGVY